MPGHDEGVRSAELQHALLQVGAGQAGDRAAGPLRAGERDAGHARVADQRGDGVDLHEEVRQHARGKSRALEEVLEELRTGRDVGRVLEEHHVAGHDRRDAEAHDLPEGEVPGHDGQDRPEGVEADPAAASAGLDRLGGEEARGVLREVAHRQGALGRLALSGREGLAHLAREHLADHGDLALDELGGAGHDEGAVRDRRGAPGPEGGPGGLQALLELGRSGDGVLGEDLARGRVGGDERHGTSLPGARAATVSLPNATKGGACAPPFVAFGAGQVSPAWWPPPTAPGSRGCPRRGCRSRERRPT